MCAEITTATGTQEIFSAGHQTHMLAIVLTSETVAAVSAGGQVEVLGAAEGLNPRLRRSAVSSVRTGV